MELNADFSQRVAVHAAKLPWIASPIAAVERRMLDRIGDEVARANLDRPLRASQPVPLRTPMAAARSFLVLEGVFQDEHGNYPGPAPMSATRRLRATLPAPRSGCVLFVKLWQFDLADRTQVRRDAQALVYAPAQGRPGVEIAALFNDSREEVRMERWQPHVSISLDLPDGGEFLVLDGEFNEGGEGFAAQSWLRLPTGGRLSAAAGRDGCTLWAKTGHLRRIQAPPEI